jgi:type IV pilus assembly protein PilB
MARSRKKIGEILKGWGLINDQQIDEALKASKASNKRIGEALVELGFCADTDVAKALASQFGLEYIDPEQRDAIKKDQITTLLPYDVIKKYLVLPLEKKDNRLKILYHDPMDFITLDNIKFRMNCDIDTAIGSRAKIKEYIERVLSETKQSIDDAVRQMTIDTMSGNSIDVNAPRGASVDVAAAAKEKQEEESEGPVMRLANKIIYEGVMQRASDIHIEPFGDRVRLRYRIDGVCIEKDTIPKSSQGGLIARIKVMSKMKIQEKRIPQDGRIKLKINDRFVDFRVAVCPCYHGESVVMRILRPESARLGLEKSGMRADMLGQFNQMIRRPNGILLVTGPTGSGKTTTLYSALNDLNRPDKKIITAEDPVEFNFKGINQCQVNEAIGLKFSLILRAMLRQAPNIVLVGEIRDKEVADVAVAAALTGHLVFSTLHTNDAPSAITRLIDIGVKPFLVASSIQAILAQRLVRLLCPKCKAPDLNPDPKMLRLVGITKQDIAEKPINKPVGCQTCNGSGYRGRQGVYEFLIMNSQIRELAFKKSPVNQIRQAAIASGMRNLLGDGRLKILDGMTTCDEVAKIAQVEGVVTDEEEPTEESKETSAA